MTTLATEKTHAPRSVEPAVRRRVWGILAEFDSPAAIFAAAGKVRDAGYRYWDCHVPFPVHNLDRQMGVRRTILPIVVFFAGLTGCTLGMALQIFTNASDQSLWAVVWVTGYPFLISGKPLLSIPAFIPVCFELTVLFAALTAAFGMLGFNQLPRLNHPLLANHRFRKATDDRFFVVIEARDPKFLKSKTEAFLKTLGARAVEVVED